MLEISISLHSIVIRMDTGVANLAHFNVLVWHSRCVRGCLEVGL